MIPRGPATTILLPLLLLLLPPAREGAPGAGSWPPRSDLPPGVLATVDGEPIPLEALYRRVAREAAPASYEGALNQLLDTRLVQTAMDRRSITVTDGDVEAKYQELDRRVKESSGGTRTIEGELARTGVSVEGFRAQLRFLVGLEKLARIDFAIGEGNPVPDAKLKVWLADLRRREGVETEGLPEGIAARGDNFEITKEEVGRSIAAMRPPAELERLTRTLVSEHLIERAIRSQKIEVGAEDLRREVALRKQLFERSDRYPDLTYDQFVRATHGMTQEELAGSREIYFQAALKKIAAERNPPEARRRYYREHRATYGPERKLQHLLVSTRGRSLEEARALAEKLRQEARGGGDFEQLVRKNSEGPNRLAGGNLGYVTAHGDLEPELLEAAFRLEPGEVSEPIRTATGFHLIRVTGVRPTAPYEEAEPLVLRDLAREWLRAEQRRAAIRPAWVAPRQGSPQPPQGG